MVIVVHGDPYFSNEARIECVLSRYPKYTVIRYGNDPTPLNKALVKVTTKLDLAVDPCLAEWEKFNDKPGSEKIFFGWRGGISWIQAGVVRNTHMLTKNPVPNLVLIFHTSINYDDPKNGCAGDLSVQARAALIPVTIIDR